MAYYSNSELADTYHVSVRTVRNWIQLAKEGKLALDLHEERGKSYLSKNSGNILTIERHLSKHKNKRPRSAMKVISPRPEFYRLFTEGQVYDIVRNLDIYHEIPRQYNYFENGAVEWDKYTKAMAEEDSLNIITQTTSLIDQNKEYIDKRIAKYEKVNVVDVGVGNALPTKGLLQHLIGKGVLGRYIAIDISQRMLEIAEQNVKEWFGDKIKFEGYELDITYERFANILAESYLRGGDNVEANIILFLGGTADNLRVPDDALRTINASMGSNDIFIHSDKLELEGMNPEWFDHGSSPGKPVLSKIHRLIFDLLNVDESFYDVEIGFDKRAQQRYSRVRLKYALQLSFDFEEGGRTLEFEKNDVILLWRSWQVSVNFLNEQFERTGFYILHSSQTDDREYILNIGQVRGN